jgi:ribonucleotide monophosphatase NagD (HAD superfamily)
MTGKPHRPIYEAALSAARDSRGGRDVVPGEVLAIGDGVLTDVKGAVENGFDLLYVTAGIHAHEYAGADGPDAEGVAGFLQAHGYAPIAAIPRLT